jgi:hypothetical protein
MKTLTVNIKSLLVYTLLALPFYTTAQNQLNNSDFREKSTYWDIKDMTVEINPETIYGGTDESNIAAGINAEAGLRQQADLKPGLEYMIRFRGSRSISKETPDDPGITIRVTGIETGNDYMTRSLIYKNTEFEFSEESLTFAIPKDAKDRGFFIEFTGYNNKTGNGVVVDDIELTSLKLLPVEIISFSGEIKNGQAVLNWKTSIETNNKHFIIERSSNGAWFDSIGNVKAANTNSSIKSYSFTDASVKTGTFFYRLRQADIDGSYSFSKVVTLKCKQDNTAGVKIFPTIATNGITVSLSAPTAAMATVSIYDASGKIMTRTSQTLSTGTNQQFIEVASLRKGIYFLHIRDNNGNISYTQSFQKM